jgi:AcrR family transcriptional regulator
VSIDSLEEEPLRERKKARLKLDMTRAAVELFQRQGFDATTVEEIATAAETSSRTFFRYFGTKEDVLFGNAPDRLQHLRAGLATTPTEAEPILVLKQALSDQIANFTILGDSALEAQCAELWMSEPTPRRRYIEIILEWETVISDFLGERWHCNARAVRPRLAAMALIAAVRVCLEHGARGRGVAQATLEEGFALLEAGLPHGG